MRLSRLRAVTPACTKRSGEGRHFGVQARRPARAGLLAMTGKQGNSFVIASGALHRMVYRAERSNLIA